MATDTTGLSSPLKRLRPVLLLLLGGLVVVVAMMQLGGSGDRDQSPSSAPRAAQQRGEEAAKVDPAALDVKLEALAGERPAPGDTERNPFRFKPKAPPPAPAPMVGPEASRPSGAILPPPPPPPPPITVKFIGTLELPQGGLVAIFTDCSVGRTNVTVREGGIILGQYRLVKVGLQSVVVEHLDGKGRTTLPKTGQECVK